MKATTKAEERLFDCERSSIELCEQFLSAPKSSKDTFATPDWFKRPGASDAVEIRADLKNRYNHLRTKVESLKDKGDELLGKVTSYEDECGKFQSWLTAERDTLDAFLPPSGSAENIKKQLKHVQV